MTEHAYYYGCHRGVGHYLFTTALNDRSLNLPDHVPWSAVDGVLQPGCKKREGSRIHTTPMNNVDGHAALHHKDGWTALAFWDRSVDARPNSTSTFMIKGTHDFETMKQICAAAFPAVWSRFTFEIVLVQTGDTP